MNILYVTSEAVPFCKTGGLADVAGSLPQSLAANGDRVSVILPLYQSVADAWRDRLHFERYTYVRLAWRSLYCGLFSYERQGVTWYFVDNEQYFKRPELYGYYDDGERFAFFCRAVTELLPLLPEKPDVVHCNDWQTALVPVYIRDEAVREEFYKSVRTVITVHNIEYQGRYGRETVEDLFGGLVHRRHACLRRRREPAQGRDRHGGRRDRRQPHLRAGAQVRLLRPRP